MTDAERLEPAASLAARILSDAGDISATVWIENRDRAIRAEQSSLIERQQEQIKDLVDVIDNAYTWGRNWEHHYHKAMNKVEHQQAVIEAIWALCAQEAEA